MHTSDLTKVIEPRVKAIPCGKCNAILGALRRLKANKVETFTGDHEEFTIYFLPSTCSAYVIRTTRTPEG